MLHALLNLFSILKLLLKRKLLIMRSFLLFIQMISRLKTFFNGKEGTEK